MRDFLTALALALAIEGVAYALFPAGMQRMMAAVQDLPPSALRAAGLAAAAAGVMGVALARGGLS
ncbi:MAG: DUF2065 family protein [Magnetospirillum sp.]|nr:DUF2065 family protein [Magnetospirillum sp.]